jgi:hypothetical protein
MLTMEIQIWSPMWIVSWALRARTNIAYSSVLFARNRVDGIVGSPVHLARQDARNDGLFCNQFIHNGLRTISPAPHWTLGEQIYKAE